MAALGTRSLVITIGGTDYTTQVSKAIVTSADSDSDFITFAAAAAGGARLYQLNIEMAQDMAATTLWRQIWDAAGTTVAFLIKPYGNATASVSQPHISGNAIISEPDGDFLGGQADSSSTARFTTEVAWDCTAKPTLVTT